jgi:SAM-dependent methyltransferase
MSTIFKWDAADMEALLATCETDGIFPYIQKYMPAPSKVLESGCGAGRYVKYLADRGWDVIGLEWDQEAVDMIKAYWPEAKAVQGDSANSPFAENTFDGIISLGVIEHWIDGPSAPLHDIYRVLKPGAYAIVTAPCLNRVRRIKKALWWNEFVNQSEATKNWLRKGGIKPNRLDKKYIYFPYPTYGEFFEYRFTTSQFKKAIKQEGLELVEHQPIAVIDGLYHELNPKGKLVTYENRQFVVSPMGKLIHKTLSAWPFTHTHHQLAIVRKPLDAAPEEPAPAKPKAKRQAKTKATAKK